MQQKILSVLMPVYNAEKFLEESILSILAQTLSNFDFLILDDASTDNSLATISKYAKQDHRIKVLANKKNQGAVVCRNKLLATAQTPFIAWLDADDLSLPHRLQTQLDFLLSNPKIDVVGARSVFIGQAGGHGVVLTDHLIKTLLFIFGNALSNSTTMMRIKKIKENNICYNKQFFAEDYKFWVDCAAVANFANLDQVLIKYRRHSQQISTKYQSILRSSHLQIMQEHFLKFKITIPENLLLMILGWSSQQLTYSSLMQIKDKFTDPLLSIKNFYGYQGIAKNLILEISSRPLCRKLDWQGELFFLKNFGVRCYLKITIQQLRALVCSTIFK